MEIETPRDRAQSFLRWAGGKTWLTRQSQQLFGRLDFEQYHEPFVGGGAFFFSLHGTQSAYLSDKNEELIEAYQCLKEDYRRVVELMRRFKNDESTYYQVRASTPKCRFERSARFIYLNQTSFNGLYRVNLKGIYNVPFGHRSKNFLDEPALQSAAGALQRSKLFVCDFMETLKNIRKNDLVFLDPPYTVSHNHNGFIKYNQSLFSIDDQHRLSDYIRQIKEIGAFYILTNAAHETIRQIFSSGDTCVELSRASLIGGRKAKRGPVTELLFTNLSTM